MGTKGSTWRRLRYFTVAATAMALSAFGLVTVGSTAPALADAGTTLSETITANPSYTTTFGWTITKSVDNNTLNLFQGDSGNANYTVTVSKDNGTTLASVSGQVCITNGGAVDAQGLQSTLRLFMPPNKTELQEQALDVSAEPVIPAQDNFCYPYTMTINNPVPGGSYKIMADTTITNHSGSTVGVGGPQETASFTLPSSATLVNDSVDVQDSLQGDLGTVSGDHTFQYSLGYPAVLQAGDNPNTATIYGDSGQPLGSASANVQVNVYQLGVSKTANTSFTRTYTWGVHKSADQSNLTLAVGETFPVNYKVDVTATPADGSWAVGGAITIHNPAPMDATLTGVSDVMSDGTQVTFTDAPQFPYNLPAGQDLVIHYTASPSGSASGNNTATATLQNTPSGTTDFGSGPVGYSFDLTHPATVVDGTAALSDTFTGSGLPATVNAGDMPKSYTYQRTVGPYATPGTYSVDNTAAVAGSDTGKGGSSSVSIPVNVPSTGCTLTIGYWKTHPAQLAKYLPQLLGSFSVSDTATAINVLQFQGQASNGIAKLMGQELGAKLSIAAGADKSAVASTITAADAFLTTHSVSSWSGLTKAQQQQVIGWAATFDNFNNGLIGPLHCSQ